MTQRCQRILRAFIGTGLTLALYTTNVAAQDADLVSQGARVYGNTCGSCHNARSPLERTDRQWTVIINHMRARANLTGSESRAVLAFLHATNADPRVQGLAQAADDDQVFQASDAPPDPALAPTGETLVAQKACLGCHIIGSTGGQVGPSLNGTVDRKGVRFVRQKLRDPTFDNATSMMPNFGLTDEQVEAITAYLATLNGK